MSCRKRQATQSQTRFGSSVRLFTMSEQMCQGVSGPRGVQPVQYLQCSQPHHWWGPKPVHRDTGRSGKAQRGTMSHKHRETIVRVAVQRSSEDRIQPQLNSGLISQVVRNRWSLTGAHNQRRDERRAQGPGAKHQTQRAEKPNP